MHIRQLILHQFKNHASLKLDFGEEITCITGRNGAGKTNILDAVYMLSTCKSYFNPTDYQLVMHGAEKCFVTGIYTNGKQTDLQLAIEPGKRKRLKKNDKYYDKLIDHIGLIRVIMITPDDIELVNGHSDIRRKFLDICISQQDRVYLNTLSEYQKLLEQRNAQLKIFARHRHFDAIVLESLDIRLVPAAEYLHACRRSFTEKLSRAFNELYPAFSSGTEKVGFTYESDLNGNDFKTLLKESTDKDLALERTSSGVHRDDILFEIDGNPLKRFASQGQGKAFIIALKLAQHRIFTQETGVPPILLLDDMFEKIDQERADKLISMLDGDSFGQILITDTHAERVKEHFENASKSINFVEL